jgi:predicted  nucleic acid-binding Zn-ribbon protein
MTTILLIVLFVLDFALLALILSNRKKPVRDDVDVTRELAEERRYLNELRTSIQEDLESYHRKGRDVLDRITKIAAEAEQEISAGSGVIQKELESIMTQITTKLDEPLAKLSEKQASIEKLLQRVDRQKSLVQKLVERGEKICKFFDQRVSYEEILDEIEDKKYSDARHLLTQGYRPEQVAKDLGLSVSEVKLIASVRGI